MRSPVQLNALRAFEASARHQSFSAAAGELHVTPAAVGQLVRSLEDWLGTGLFVRNTIGKTRLVLTETALRALPDIRAGFDRLSLGLERLREPEGSGVLTVTVSPAFASKWLLPRLERFQVLSGDIDVRLEIDSRPLDFVSHEVDIGVRFGAGHWPGLKADRLMDEEVYPVCAPEWASRFRQLEHPAELQGVPLIHDVSMPGNPGFPTWATWFGRFGVAEPVPQRGLKINNSAAVLQAAAEGRGVALARSVMAGDDVAAGRLLRLLPQVGFASSLAYYVVYRPECAELPGLVAFRDWLLREAALRPEDFSI